MLCEVAALPLQTHAYYENWSIALNLSKQFVDNSSKIGYVVVSDPPSIYICSIIHIIESLFPF